MLIQAAEGHSAATWLGERFHWVLLAYGAVYSFSFLVPLFRRWRAESFASDLQQLRARLRADRDVQEATTAEGQRAALRDELAVLRVQVDQAQARERAAEAAQELEEAGRLRNGVLPALREQAAAAEERLRSVRDDPPGLATSRLVSLRALTGSYNDPMVADAVEQLRSQFPRADAQRFDLGLIPSVSAYQERVSVARTMAGVFVLLGLLGTMIRLNGVVGVISRLTQSTELPPDVFLGRMGALMSGIGGAFDHSIHGVLLMITALIGVSLIDRAVQRRIETLDAVMVREVVPGLADIQNRYLPELSLADVLRATGRQLQTLDRTVDGLTSGMGAALSGLENRIQEMLQQFGTVQQHYVTLNSWVAKLEDASVALTGTSRELDRASDRLGRPIDEMNAALREHLRAQAEFLDAAYLEKELSRVADRLSRPMDEMIGTLREHLRAQAELNGQAYLSRLLEEVKATLEGSRREQEAALEALAHSTRESLAQSAAASQQQAAAATAHTEMIERELGAVRDALRATSGEQIGGALAGLQSTTDTLALRLERSAGAFEDASRALAAYAAAPTFFYWLTQVAVPRLLGRRRR